MQDVTKPASLLSFIICRIFLSSSTLCNASSFLTRPVQRIFSILLQHISKLSGKPKSWKGKWIRRCYYGKSHWHFSKIAVSNPAYPILTRWWFFKMTKCITYVSVQHKNVYGPTFIAILPTKFPYNTRMFTVLCSLQYYLQYSHQ